MYPNLARARVNSTLNTLNTLSTCTLITKYSSISYQNSNINSSSISTNGISISNINASNISISTINTSNINTSNSYLPNSVLRGRCVSTSDQGCCRKRFYFSQRAGLPQKARDSRDIALFDSIQNRTPALMVVKTPIITPSGRSIGLKWEYGWKMRSIGTGVI